MSFHDPVRDGKTQTKSRGLSARPGLLGTVETLEDVRQVFSRDTRSRVTADNPRLLADLLQAQEDISALGRVLHRIRNKVDKHLLEPVAVPIHVCLIDVIQPDMY